MAQNVVTNLESKSKISKHLNIGSLVFVVVWFMVFFMFKELVNPYVQIPYYIFNIVFPIILMFPSSYNTGRNILASIFLMLKRDEMVYRQYVPEEKITDGEE